MSYRHCPRFTTLLLLASSGVATAQTRVAPFPPIGGGQSQIVRINLIALGAVGATCRAMVGFRSASGGNPIGAPTVVSLHQGESTTTSLFLGSIGIGAGERAQVQPVVELADSSCFPSVSLAEGSGRLSSVYVSGSMLAPSRPAEALDSPFIDARQTDNVELAVTRTQPADAEAQPCDVHLGFRNDSGAPIGPQSDVSLAAGDFRLMTLNVGDFYPPQGNTNRILLDIRPTQDGSAGGCAAAAQAYDRASGNTSRYFPIALPAAVTALAAPPPAQPKTDPPPLPPIGGPKPIGQPVTLPSPLGLPPLAIPADNPPTAETIALGRRLFYDKRLSMDDTVACASCHDPAASFSDARRLSLGVNGSDGERHSMSVVNAALSQDVFWDGRSAGLEAQAREPVRGVLEFAHSLQGAEQRLQADPTYVKQFEAAFGPGPIFYDMAAKAIATFERTLLSGNSPFDRFFFKGQRNALSASAQRGFDSFQIRCVVCHQIEGSYATFGNTRFFNTGVAAINATTLQDQGRWKVTGNETDRGAFRPPSLRNVELRAPYMHDGSMATLLEVVRFYSTGGKKNFWLSPEMPPLGNPTTQDLNDLTEFLRSLTGDVPENAGPLDQP